MNFEQNNLKEYLKKLSTHMYMLKEIAIDVIFEKYAINSRRMLKSLEQEKSKELVLRKFYGDSYFFSILTETIALLLEQNYYKFEEMKKINLEWTNDSLQLPSEKYKRLTSIDYENITQSNFPSNCEFLSTSKNKERNKIKSIIGNLKKCEYLGFYSVKTTIYELYRSKNCRRFQFKIDVYNGKRCVEELYIIE